MIYIDLFGTMLNRSKYYGKKGPPHKILLHILFACSQSLKMHYCTNNFKDHSVSQT